MTLVAAVRPDGWNLPLFVHVLGAMLLVGGVSTALLLQLTGWRRQEPAAALQQARFAFWTLLVVAFPAWWVMRLGAEWIYARQGWGDAAEEPLWIGIGYITADLGGLLLLLAIVLGGIGVRRLRRTGAGSSTLVRASTVLVTISVLAYVVAVWAMSGKPG
jgi:hypothetical protein